ncbi:hypothetical protein ONE63_009542 [Megalurothrips usitatus]|uniref:Uncharacterized protein n=1 Tax=Megalurothrips usitatus TaxID=439358 RepID=A0AAV7XJX9_9NEOP|nr:hypothetical protein ONE63_009542 [Megalurothrips usitatus]
MVGRTNVIMDVQARFIRPAKSFHKISVSKVACSEAVSSNTCSHPQEWVFSSGVCAILSAPLMPWTPIFASMQPAFKCPMNAVR